MPPTPSRHWWRNCADCTTATTPREQSGTQRAPPLVRWPRAAAGSARCACQRARASAAAADAAICITRNCRRCRPSRRFRRFHACGTAAPRPHRRRAEMATALHHRPRACRACCRPQGCSAPRRRRGRAAPRRRPLATYVLRAMRAPVGINAGDCAEIEEEEEEEEAPPQTMTAARESTTHRPCRRQRRIVRPSCRQRRTRPSSSTAPATRCGRVGRGMHETSRRYRRERPSVHAVQRAAVPAAPGTDRHRLARMPGAAVRRRRRLHQQSTRAATPADAVCGAQHAAAAVAAAAGASATTAATALRLARRRHAARTTGRPRACGAHAG